MWRSYNLGWRIVRQRVKHLLFRLGLINLSKIAQCFHQGLFRMLRLRSHPNCLQAFSSLKSSIGNECYQNSVLLPLTGNGGAEFFTHSSWHLLRGAEGVEGWSTLIFPFLHLSSSLHNSVSGASSTLVKCLPSSLSVKADFLKAAFICFTISLSPPLFEISHDRASLS